MIYSTLATVNNVAAVVSWPLHLLLAPLSPVPFFANQQIWWQRLLIRLHATSDTLSCPSSFQFSFKHSYSLFTTLSDPLKREIESCNHFKALEKGLLLSQRKGNRRSGTTTDERQIRVQGKVQRPANNCKGRRVPKSWAEGKERTMRHRLIVCGFQEEEESESD